MSANLIIVVELDGVSREFSNIADAAEYLGDYGVAFDSRLDLVGAFDSGEAVIFPNPAPNEPVAEYRERARREHLVVGRYAIEREEGFPMIVRFEEITKPLSEYAKTILVPMVVDLLLDRVGAEKAITNARLRDAIDTRARRLAREYSTPEPKPVADATVRAVIHRIRAEGLVADLVASSAGYYVAETAKDVIEYAESLRERADSILAVRRSLFIHSKLIPPPLDGGQLPLNL